MKAEIIEILGSCYCLPQQDKELIKENIRSLESQLKERDEVLDDVLNYIQNSDDSYFSSLATRIRTFKTK